MIRFRCLPDGCLEIFNNGLLLHTVAPPEAYLLASSIIRVHALCAVREVMEGHGTGVSIEVPSVSVEQPAPAPTQTA